ncbi:unnamed protein product [Calicophoron daubneyi]|uniref:Egal-1 winged helix domain-containing protein n=1 Tax=Calicophoron daubneyi TaxID=300641 RepID=A0AAV2TEL1_CALDB
MSEIYSLAVLEYLVQTNGCRRVDEVWAFLLARFRGSPDFHSNVGYNVDGFLAFIERQPALFKTYGGLIYTPDVFDEVVHRSGQHTSVGMHHHGNSYGRSSAILDEAIPGTSEVEAVKYFQEQLLKKADRWVSIKSLAGHLSQASPNVRMVVGPQTEFANFLQKHPLFFDIQGELVGLRDNFRLRSHATPGSSGKKKCRPLSSQCNDNHRRNCNERPRSLNITMPCCSPVSRNTPKSNHPGKLIHINLDECKAILWLRSTVDRTPDRCLGLSSLLQELSKAPKCVSSSVGWTQIELMELIRKYDKVFAFDDDTHIVSGCPVRDVELLVDANDSNHADSNILLAQRGSVFCINKLWGIIDLGMHEHVFFDRSLFKHVTDLSRHFQVKESVFFNAVLAPKESRAKWRATCVWKETDQLASYIQNLSASNHVAKGTTEEALDDPDSGLDNSDELRNVNSRTTSLRSMFTEVEEAFDHCVGEFASIRLADGQNHDPQLSKTKMACDDQFTPILQEAECDLEASFRSDHSDLHSLSSSPVSELNTLSGIPSISGNGDLPCSAHDTYPLPGRFTNGQPFAVQDVRLSHPGNIEKDGESTRSVAIQTLFTGEIMATKLYHDETSLVAI